MINRAASQNFPRLTSAAEASALVEESTDFYICTSHRLIA